MIVQNSAYLYNHQGKGEKYMQALRTACFGQLRKPKLAQVIMMDIDIPPRMTPLKPNLQVGRSRAFCYPHSARAPIHWDGHHRPSGYTTACFVSAPGHIEVLEA